MRKSTKRTLLARKMGSVRSNSEMREKLTSTTSNVSVHDHSFDTLVIGISSHNLLSSFYSTFRFVFLFLSTSLSFEWKSQIGYTLVRCPAMIHHDSSTVPRTSLNLSPMESN